MMDIDIDLILDSHPYVEEILEKLQRAGFETVIVGGAVRDLLRERFEEDFAFCPEEADIDIATSASTDDLRDLFPNFNSIEVGESFGVIVLVVPDGNQYEIAQFRTEKDYDGRRPREVNSTDSLRKDVKRRDFTVNGLALTRNGRVIDHVNGISDLRNKVIRAIGDPQERFEEDYLRILRAVRVSCELEGVIENDTRKAIQEVSGKITSISWERIREELIKILATMKSSEGMRLLEKTGLLEEILPEMSSNKGIPQPEEYHPEGDVLEHSFRALEVADQFEFSPLNKLAIFLHDVGKADAFFEHNQEHMGGHAQKGKRKAEKIARRLRLSNEQTEKLIWLIENHMKGSMLPRMRKAKQVKLIRFKQDSSIPLSRFKERFSYFSDLVRMIIADSEASSHKAEGWLPVLRTFAGLLPHLQHLDELGAARELIDGNDLKCLGMEEGPRLGEVLKEIHEMIYAGEVEDRDSALELAEEMVDRPPGG